MAVKDNLEVILDKAAQEVRHSFRDGFNWKQDAECRSDADLFFPPDTEEEEEPDMREARESAAKLLCAVCDINVQCLSYASAFTQRTEDGIWGGGANGRERRTIRGELGKEVNDLPRQTATIEFATKTLGKIIKSRLTTKVS